MLQKKTRPCSRALSLLLAAALMLTAAISFSITPAAASAGSVAGQIQRWGNTLGSGPLYASSSGNVVTVRGDVGGGSTSVATNLELNLDANVIVMWYASLWFNNGSNVVGAISVTGDPSAEFVLCEGSTSDPEYNYKKGIIKTESQHVRCISVNGPKFTMNGGKLQQGTENAFAGGHALYLDNCPLATINNGTIEYTNAPTSNEDGSALYAYNSNVYIKNGKVLSNASCYAVKAEGKSTVLYESAATVTGIKYANSSSSSVIAKITAANPLPQADIGTGNGITVEADGSNSATATWEQNSNDRADIYVICSTNRVHVPVNRAIAGLMATISITGQPVTYANTMVRSEPIPLTVTASVSPTKELTYQWYFEQGGSSNLSGTAIPGATSSTYTVPATRGLWGSYYCIVSALGAQPVRSNATEVIVRPYVTASAVYSPNPLRKGSAGTITVTYTMTGSEFADTIDDKYYAVTALPDGMTAGTPVRVDDNHVTVKITGTPTSLVKQIQACKEIAAAQFAPYTSSGSSTILNNKLSIAMANPLGANVSAVPTFKSHTTDSITVNAVTNAGTTGQTVEYAISTDSGLSGAELNALAWQDGTTFSSLNQDTEYYVYARTKANVDYDSGTARVSDALIVKTNRSIAVTATGLSNLSTGTAVNGTITFKLTNGTYASMISPDDFHITGLPQGLSASRAVRTSGTVVTVEITGAPEIYYQNAVTLRHETSIPAINITGALADVPVSGTIQAGPVGRRDVSGDVTFAPGSKTYTGGELDSETPLLNGESLGFDEVSFTYTAKSSGASLGTSNKPLTAGEYDVTVTYEDQSKTFTATGVFTVTKADQESFGITNSDPLAFGDAPFQLTVAGGNTTGAVTYELVSGNATVTSDGMVTITGVGDIVVKATKAGDNNYNAITSSNCTLTVSKGAPRVDWPADFTAVYGQTLSEISLAECTNNPAGTFTWTTPTDAVGDAGRQAHSMTFTPEDSTNYIPQAADVTITVTPQAIANAAITVTSPTTAAAPDTAASGTGNFSIGAVSWSPSDALFKGNTQYTAAVTLTANANYTFTGIASAVINENNATIVSNTGTALTLSYQFSATGAAALADMQPASPPAKLSYDYGETLDLDGLTVKLLYNDGTDEIVAAADFASKNIAASPANGASLTKDDSGKGITVTCGTFTFTTDALTVNTQDHPHTWPTDWTTDASDHWKACECGERNEQAVHTISDWIVDSDAIPGTDGSKHKECTVCGYVAETAKIPALPNISLAGKIERKNIWWRRLLHVITFGIFWKEFQEVTITPDAAGVKVEYCITNKDVTKEQIAESDWKPYSAPFRFHPPLFCKKIVYARLTDAYGNENIIAK